MKTLFRRNFRELDQLVQPGCRKNFPLKGANGEQIESFGKLIIMGAMGTPEAYLGRLD